MSKSPPVNHIIETVIYAPDLVAAELFYYGVMGWRCFSRSDNHVFFAVGHTVLLVFVAEVSRVAQAGSGSLSGTGDVVVGSSISVTIYRKTLTVKALDREQTVRSGNPSPVWEAETEEQGWCNRILSTAPHIIAAMFSHFGALTTNYSESVFEDDSRARRVMEMNPYDTNC